MPRRLYPCTPTRLLTWLDCPRRYRFTYLDRPAPPKGPPWAHTSLGASVHTALAALVAPAAAPPHPRARRPRWCARPGCATASATTTSRAGARARRAMVEPLPRGLDPADEPLGVERTVSATAPGARPVGPDRSARRPARRQLVVVDYKTGRRPPSDDDAAISLALAFYAVAAAARSVGPAPWSSCTTCRPVRSRRGAHAGDLARKIAEAESIAREARAADEAGRLARRTERSPRGRRPLCSWCDFRGTALRARRRRPNASRGARCLSTDAPCPSPLTGAGGSGLQAGVRGPDVGALGQRRCHGLDAP